MAEDVIQIQNIILTFINTIKLAMKDMFTLFGDSGWQIIMILALLTCLVITAGGILTVYYMLMRSLQPR